MVNMGRWTWLLVLLAMWLIGCRQEAPRPVVSPQVPVVRVRLLESQSQILLSASTPPIVRSASDPLTRRLGLSGNAAVQITYGPAGWRLGNVQLPGGELTIQPAADGTVAINGQRHRGRYRLVPVGPNFFDVINDVDVDSYLKGVVSKELLSSWNLETYKAQAIVARTYALYEAGSNASKTHWDLYPDQRSQVYGGIAAETNKSRIAVDATSGVVVAYGSPGQERIFKAYFSACCGGIAQSATHAFGDAYIEPLTDRNQHGMCGVAPRYNWGPVAISKQELTRRIRAWGVKKNRAEKDIATVAAIQPQAVNRFGRPVRFLLTDSRGVRYSLGGEELRAAINTDAAGGSIVYSSFFKTINDADQIRFVEGHGHGHGVGMCQWCAQVQADNGVRHETIVLRAYPGSKLIRAY